MNSKEAGAKRHACERYGVALRSPSTFSRFLCFGLILCLTQVCATADAADNPPERLVLTLAGFPYQAEKKLATEGLDEFTRRTGIGVDFVPAWGNSADQLSLTRKALERHLASPDVVMIDAVWPGTLGDHLLDMRKYLNGEGSAHLPELLRNDTVKGRLVALPFYLNIGMLYYRTDLLEKYGYKHPPNTWDELERMAARIQKGERAEGHGSFWGFVFQGAAYEGLTCNALEWQMSFGGGHIVEQDGTISVSNPQAAQALRKASRWVGSIAPPSVLSYTEADSLNAFRSGNAAFLRYWSSGYASITNNPSLRGRCDVTLLPAGPAGRALTMGGFQLAVSAYSKHPREAVELVLYLTSSRVEKSRALQEGYLPTLPKLYEDSEVLATIPEAKALRTVGLESWVARPSSVAESRYAEISRAYYEGVHAILDHEGAPEDVLGAVADKLFAIGPNLRLRAK